MNVEPIVVTLRRVIVLVPLLFSAPHYAAAMECAKARTGLEKAICGDAETKAVDAAMSQTYFETLKRLPANRHDVLIASQRKWLASGRDACEDQIDKERPSVFLECLKDELGDRRDAILREFPIPGYSGHPDPRDLDRQPLPQDQAQRFEGDWKDRAHWNGEEVLTGYVLFQKGNRICGENSDWATGRTYSQRLTAIAEGNEARVSFMCFNPDNQQAPCEDREDRHLPVWSKNDLILKICDNGFQLSSNEASGNCQGMRRGFNGHDIKIGHMAWVQACLNDPNFPAKKDIQP